jgi:N-acetylneuraminic acid mutarotase
MEAEEKYGGYPSGLKFRAFLGLICYAAMLEAIPPAQPLAATQIWTETGNLNTAREGHSATLLLDGRVLVVGGEGDGGTLKSAELYDPATGTWRVTGSLNLPRRLFSATLLPNGKVLVAGGYTEKLPPSFGVTNTVELFDPATETWSLTGNLSTPRAWHAATLLSGQVMVLGGWGETSELNTAEIYDPDTGQWSRTGQLVTPRYGPTATLLQDGKILVAGGSDNGDLSTTLASAELYDPDVKAWKDGGSLGTSRISHTATRLPSGVVLVAGGYTWPPFSFATSELYDPPTEKWNSTGRLSVARDSHTALLLPNGKVLVAGGYDWSRRVFVNSAELYNPSTGTWSNTAPLNTARRNHTATLLNTGKVLVAGGAGGRISNGAELYSDYGMNSEGVSNVVTRISNLAVRAHGGGDTPFSADFTVGPGSEQTILIRAVGPSLAALGIESTLADPKLAVFDAKGVRVADNDDFSAAAADMFATVGAFPLRSGAKDAALVVRLPAGRYAAQISGETAGSTLLEIYEAIGRTLRIVNMSTRAEIASDGETVITGITVAPGTERQRLLIRAIGPTLASLGQPTEKVLSDPKIEIYAGAVKLAENDNWSEPYLFPFPAAEAFAQGGAFTLPLNSQDAALVHEFSTGNYTVVTRGPARGRGNVMVEVIALPSASPPVLQAPAGILGLVDFTVTVRKVGDLYEYIPKFRFLETGRAWSVIVTRVEWVVEYDGIGERLLPWEMFLRIPAGGSFLYPEDGPALNPTAERRFLSPHEYSRISARIVYLDDDISFGYFNAVARMIR